MKYFVIETKNGDSWETECKSKEEAIEKAIDTYEELSDYDRKHQSVIAASRLDDYKETECYDLQDVYWDSDQLKTVEEMNLSWNYTQVRGEHFDYCGDENLALWLRYRMEPDEIYSAIEVADDYIKGLEEDGREPACVIWFD